MTLTLNAEFKNLSSISKQTRSRFNRRYDLQTRIARLEQYLETQHTITRIIASSSELKLALPRILQAICETTDWDFGEVWYINRQDDRLHCEATWCKPSISLPKFEDSGRAITFPLGKGLPGRVWSSGKSAWVPNVVLDQNFMRTVTAEQDGLQAGIAIPVRTEGAMIGILTLFSRHFREVDQELLQMLETAGNQIGLFIERKRAEQLEREKEWLLAASQERQRLARDLHDSVTQTLFSTSVIAEMLPMLWECNPDRVAPGLQEIHELTRDALSEMRALVSEMRDPSPECSDLSIMLKGLAEKLTTRTKIAVNLDIKLPITPSKTVQMTLYRITQECLNNIAKHASADQVWVRLNADHHTITLRIEDDGQGFDLSTIPAGHFGVTIMNERAEEIGSTLYIDSTPGEGTCVSVHIPLIA